MGKSIQRSITDQDKQVAFVAQSYLLHWSYGVERFYWYSWNGGDWELCGRARTELIELGGPMSSFMIGL
jgi:hypothetical protein